MRALITGCTGQDGAYLSALLLEHGYNVTGSSPRRSADDKNLWRLRTKNAGTYRSVLDHPNFEFVSLDVTCSASVNNVIGSYDYDEIYNLAAQSFVAESFKSPAATAAINYIGVLNLLEAVRTLSPLSRFYQASTSEMFGRVNVGAQNEFTPFHPRSPYATAKAAAHHAVVNYREAYGLLASCGILFNHESPLRGIEFVTRKITDGAAQIVAGKRDSLLLGNMDSRRDWGHAEDYTYAMYLMMQQELPDDYVIATGKAHSVRDAVNFVFERVGLDPHERVSQDPRFSRPSDVPFLCGNADKAREKLGWKPTHTFEDMMYEMLSIDLQRHCVDPIQLIATGGMSVAT